MIIKTLPLAKDYLAEKATLEAFAGHGCIKILDYDELHLSLLLHRAIPGDSLRDHLDRFPTQEYSNVILGLNATTTPTNLEKLEDWLKVFDRVSQDCLPYNLVTKAHSLSKELRNDPQPEVLLHGDLHCDNIIQDGSNWVAIDPKGLIGEACFEVAKYDFFSDSMFRSDKDLQPDFHKQVETLCKNLNLPKQRLLDWIFVRRVMGALWMIEDNSSPDYFLRQVEKLFPAQMV